MPRSRAVDAELNRVERPQLLASLYTSIFFNWNIWCRAPAPVQRELLSDLAMQAAERAGFVDFRRYGLALESGSRIRAAHSSTDGRC